MDPEVESAPKVETASAEASSGEAAVPVRRARLWNRDFGLVLSGQTVSQLGNQAFSVAMAFWLVEATGSASLMGLLLTASTLPGVLLGPVGGAVADRFNRIKIAVVADLVGGIAMTGLALVMFPGRASTSTLVALLFAVAVLMGTVRAFFLPALGAAIPDLVPPGRLAAANSLTQLMAQGALLVGQGVGGILYSVLGAPLLFLFDGLSYLVAAGSEAFVRLPPHRREAVAEAGAGPGLVFRRFWTDIKEAMAYVKSTRGLLGFVLAAAGYNFFLMPIVVLLPFFVADYLGRGARWYGFLLAAISAGEIVGFLLAGIVRLRGRAKANFLVGLMVLAPTPFALIGFIRSAPVSLAVAVALGAAIGMINVHVMTIMQASTPQELRGRVMGLLGTLGGAVIPVGMALGGIAGDLTGKNVPLVYTTCGVASFVFTLAALLRPGTRDFLARD